MITKINLNVVAEDEEEKKIENYLNILHKSEEVKSFLDKMQKTANNNSVYQYSARIKNVNSAIRTHRINQKNLDEVGDYVGVEFITNNDEDIAPIVNSIKPNITNADYLDLTTEESIYSPVVYQKFVPPMIYNILAKEPLIKNQMNVPIEIRVCSKAGYISEQSAYYAVHKNDTITLPLDQKRHLRDLVQHISYKLALLNINDLTEVERNRHIQELNKLINDNKDFLKANDDICKDATLDLGRLIYKFEHDKELKEDEKNLPSEVYDGLDDKIKNKFASLIEYNGSNFIEAVSTAINKMRTIPYDEVTK